MRAVTLPGRWGQPIVLRISVLIGVLVMACIMAGGAFAWDYGTKDEAKAMAERAARFYTENGKSRAFQAFQNGTDGFKDRDLYVFVYSDAGTCVSHGANPAMIGRNLIDLVDGDGKLLIREIVAVKTAGWVMFQWRNPQNHEIQPKASYVVRAGEYLFGVGAYENPVLSNGGK
jgi:signal transduction histidine kinase